MGILDQIGEDEAAFDAGLPVARVRCLADIAPRPVRWLWPGRIPLGKLTLICGDPGLGKSYLTLDLAARLSVGGAWPDGAASATGPGSAVLITAEDEADDTIRPRSDAVGADVSRIVMLDSVAWRDEDGRVRERLFELTDVEPLRRVVARTPDCRLLVIDPVSAFVGGYDSHNNAEIRSLLAPLAKLAADTGVAVVAVTHLSKGGGGRAVYRAMGSLAFVAAARCAWLVARDRANPDRRLLLPIKNNLGDDQGGLAYGIVGGALAWERDPVTLRADDVLADGGGGGGSQPPSKPGPEQTARVEAVEWLREMLSGGPVATAQLRHEAEGLGFSAMTLRRAKGELNARAFRETSNGPWSWQLPAGATAGGEPDNLNISNISNIREGDRASAHQVCRPPGAEDARTAPPSPKSQALQTSKMLRSSGERAPGRDASTATACSLFHGPFGLPDVR